MKCEYFWKKKAIVSFVLSILVVMIHTLQIETLYSLKNNYMNVSGQIIIFFRDNFSAVAVPLFFMLSGVSYFRDYKGFESYKEKTKRRVQSLVVPYLSWNAIYLVYNILTTKFLSKYFTGRKAFELSVKNVISSLLLYKGNGHFWYLFDLIVFSLCGHIIYKLIANKRNAIVFLPVLLIVSCMANNVEIIKKIFYAPQSITYFALGGILAIHYKAVFIDLHKRKTIFSCLGMYMCVLVLRQLRINWNTAFPIWIGVIVNCFACILFWIGLDLVIPQMSVMRYMKHHFFVYAFHGMILPIIIRVVYLILPKSIQWSCINFFLSVGMTVIASIAASMILEKKFPRLSRCLSGKR